MLKYITIAAALLAVIEGFPKLQFRISGGNVDTIESHPYIVSIRFNGGHGCAGTIISENIIITAGHCAPIDKKIAKIVVGSSFSKKDGTEHNVESVITHKDFKIISEANGRTAINDIALIAVEPPFVFNDNFQPISLFNADEKVMLRSFGTVLGWGTVPDKDKLNSTSEDRSFNQLRSVVIPIHEHSYCVKEMKKYNNTLKFGKICAGGNGKGTCKLDSGGPLIVNGRLAAIVSGGYTPCGRLGLPPSVYTEVAYYRKWIDENVQKLSKSQKENRYDYVDESPVWN